MEIDDYIPHVWSALMVDDGISDYFSYTLTSYRNSLGFPGDDTDESIC